VPALSEAEGTKKSKQDFALSFRLHPSSYASDEFSKENWNPTLNPFPRREGAGDGSALIFTKIKRPAGMRNPAGLACLPTCAVLYSIATRIASRRIPHAFIRQNRTERV